LHHLTAFPDPDTDHGCISFHFSMPMLLAGAASEGVTTVARPPHHRLPAEFEEDPQACACS